MREQSAQPGRADPEVPVLPVDPTEQNGYLIQTLEVEGALIHKDFAAGIEELYR